MNAPAYSQTGHTGGMSTLTAATTPLTPADRCDGCGARAGVRATKGDQVLLFCGHHTRENKDYIMTWADHVHDELSILV